MPPQYEVRAKDRIKRGLQEYSTILAKAAERGINEEDTSVIVQAMLVDLLGYDRFWEISGQFQVKGHWADWAVKLDDKVMYFVEVKQLGTKLRDKDLFQVINYSVPQGLSWAVLTTGDVWQCHRVAGGKDIQEFFEVRVLDPNQSVREKVDYLYLLSREGMKRSALEAHWSHAECYRPEKLAALVVSEQVLTVLRRLVKREKPGRRVQVTELREALLRGVIRGDLQASVHAAAGSPARKRASGGKKRRAELTPSPDVETGALSGSQEPPPT
jgi:hypothetical protein